MLTSHHEGEQNRPCRHHHHCHQILPAAVVKGVVVKRVPSNASKNGGSS